MSRAASFAFVALVPFVALAATPSCRRDTPPAASTQGASGAGGGTVTAASAGATRPPSRRLQDPGWRRAAGDDPLEHARLASVEGASGLLEALDDGGEVTTAALRALPYADDADLALGPLTARARAAGATASLEPLLQAVLGVAGRPARPREPVDPEGVRAAAASLLELARRGDLPAGPRALAVSAARALADKGYLDAAGIPTDLDPAKGGAGPGVGPP